MPENKFMGTFGQMSELGIARAEERGYKNGHNNALVEVQNEIGKTSLPFEYKEIVQQLCQFLKIQP